MIINDVGRCKSTTKAGDQCAARALSGKDYCFFHQPDKEITRRAQITGGKTGKRLPKDSLKIKCMKDVQLILDDTINEVRKANGNPLVKARTIGFLVSIIMRYFEARGEVLEKVVEAPKPGFFSTELPKLPANVRAELEMKFRERKDMLIHWFVEEVQKAVSIHGRRELDISSLNVTGRESVRSYENV